MVLAVISHRDSSEGKEMECGCGWRGLEKNVDVSGPLKFSAWSTAAPVLQIRRPQPDVCEK